MKNFNLIFILIALCLFTASCDLFLQVNLGGFTVRFTQAALIVLILLALTHALYKGKSIIPLGFPSLLIWSLFMIAFIPHTTVLSRSILYCMWLLLSIAGIYAIVQFIHSEERLRLTMRLYILSFVIIALFGFLQFFAGLLGISLLTQQWYIPGRIPRINAFCYEPAFFAFYLIQGFVLTAYLRETGSMIMPRKYLNICYWIIFSALIFSTSRAGWLLAWLWFSRPALLFVFHLLRGRFYLSYFRKTCLKVLLPLSLLVLTGYILVEWFSIRYFISGIGFLGGGSHSSGTRLNDFMDLMTIFFKSPFIGYSLGGIASAIGALHGASVETNEQAKNFEGVSVFGQILAASGIIGVIPFVVYMYQLIAKPFQIAKNCNDELRKILIGLTLGLIFALIILQSGQNILRPYLWLHIALLSAAYATAKRSPQYCENIVY